MNASLRRVVILVALLNLGYFGIEFAVTLAIGSVSLFADSIDFLEDASVNFLISVALGWGVGLGIAALNADAAREAWRAARDEHRASTL